MFTGIEIVIFGDRHVITIDYKRSTRLAVGTVECILQGFAINLYIANLVPRVSPLHVRPWERGCYIATLQIKE